MNTFLLLTALVLLASWDSAIAFGETYRHYRSQKTIPYRHVGGTSLDNEVSSRTKSSICRDFCHERCRNDLRGTCLEDCRQGDCPY